MKITKIGIIGYGFVGKAVEFGFKNESNDIMIVDPYQGHHNIDDLWNYAPEYIFVCVPTPMRDDGSVNSDTIRNVVGLLEDEAFGNSTVIIKSTITPDVIKSLCRNRRFVYNPEFLTERNAFDDFLNPRFHILGGHPEHTKRAKNLYAFNSNCNPAPYHYMTPEEASLVKYGINSFLALKVVWFNQWKDLADGVGARYNVVSNAIAVDPRIGGSHIKVPGLDGKRGYGGSCFPKDTAAIVNYAESIDVALSVLKEAVHSNNLYRMAYELDDREKEQNVSFGSKK